MPLPVRSGRRPSPTSTSTATWPPSVFGLRRHELQEAGQPAGLRLVGGEPRRAPPLGLAHLDVERGVLGQVVHVVGDGVSPARDVVGVGAGERPDRELHRDAWSHQGLSRALAGSVEACRRGAIHAEGTRRRRARDQRGRQLHEGRLRGAPSHVRLARSRLVRHDREDGRDHRRQLRSRARDREGPRARRGLRAHRRARRRARRGRRRGARRARRAPRRARTWPTSAHSTTCAGSRARSETASPVSTCWCTTPALCSPSAPSRPTATR